MTKEMELYNKSLNGDDNAKEELLNRYLKTVLKISIEYSDKSSLGVDDYSTIGMIGLIKSLHIKKQECISLRQHIESFIHKEIQSVEAITA